MIRISSNYMVQRYQKDLNELDYTKSKLMEQGDGKKLHRPSDNSVDYSRYLRYNVSEGENNRYQDSVKAGISWMNTDRFARQYPARRPLHLFGSGGSAPAILHLG